MIDNEELGIKVAENSDEKFWEEMLEKTAEAIKAEKRNIKVNEKLAELASQEIETFK